MGNWHCLKCGKPADRHGHGCLCKEPAYYEESFEDRWMEEEREKERKDND